MKLWFLSGDFEDEESNSKELYSKQFDILFPDWKYEMFSSPMDIYTSSTTQPIPPDLIIIDMGCLGGVKGQFELTVRSMIANMFYNYESTPIFLCSGFLPYTEIAKEELEKEGFSPIFLESEDPYSWAETLNQYGFNLPVYTEDGLYDEIGKNSPKKPKLVSPRES